MDKKEELALIEKFISKFEAFAQMPNSDRRRPMAVELLIESASLIRLVVENILQDVERDNG